MDQLSNLRSKIDKIDAQIMSLLEKRFNLAVDVANTKKTSKTAILDTNRENIILDKTLNYSHSPHIELVYKTIMAESKSIQRK